MGQSKGLLHVYTGNGKGKTTAALGLMLRASGAGLKCIMVQFMKGRRYSEVDAAEKIENFTIEQHGRDEFVNKQNPEEIDIELAKRGFERAKEVIGSGEYDLVVLDEINVALDFKLLELNDVLKLVMSRPANVEIALTGRYAPKELIEIADLVSSVEEIKHPYQKGIQARKGIDW